MKKIAAVFLSLLSLMMFLTGSAAAGVPGQRDPLEFASSAAPELQDAPAQNASEPAPPIDGSGDAPADESTYREEPPQDCTPTQRLPGRGTVDDICAYWEENGYPGDVSYAYLGGGEMIGDTVYGWWEIGLVGNDPARQQEILDLMAPTSLVEFKNALFSHGEKVRAYDTITELAVTDPNILSVIFVRNDDSVWVAVPEDMTKDYAKYLIRDLGLGAVVSVTDEGSAAAVITEDQVITAATPGGGLDMGPAPGGAGAVPPAPRRELPPVWVWGAAAALAAAVLTIFALRRRPIPAAVTEAGPVHTAPPLTRRQTARLVADAVEVPDAAVYAALLAKVKEARSSKE